MLWDNAVWTKPSWYNNIKRPSGKHLILKIDKNGKFGGELKTIKKNEMESLEVKNYRNQNELQ